MAGPVPSSAILWALVLVEIRRGPQNIIVDMSLILDEIYPEMYILLVLDKL